MTWDADAEQGNEAAKIRHIIVPYTRGKGLDLGCGPWKAWPHFISYDNINEWDGFEWAPDIRGDAEDLSVFSKESMDFVFSSHLLEHMKNPKQVLREWWRVIKTGGYLVLYLPDKRVYPNMGEHGSNPDHQHDFLPSDIEKLMRGIRGWTMVHDETRHDHDEYSFLQVYRKDAGKKCHKSLPSRFSTDKEKLLVIRYGGFGDALIAASTLKELHKGYHITYQAVPNGHDVLIENPYVDEFWVQDKDQVPNEGLTDYWVKCSQEFDRTINLSESMEGLLLALPGRRNHAMPQGARHLQSDINYVEMAHAIADVSNNFDIQFYETEEERDRSKKTLTGFSGPVLLWCLAGSSVHKAWPWGDVFLNRLLEETDYNVVFVGDALCQYLERGLLQTVLLYKQNKSYEETNKLGMHDLLKRVNRLYGKKRILCLSGQINIRKSLSLAKQADIVLGPETGVLNAVSMDESVHKICMLSHSSHENLTKHWKNTTHLIPDVPCWPCHRLHYDRTFCVEDEETGASACAAAITPETVMDAIHRNT